MARAKVAPTHTQRAQHPRILSSSSSSISSSSSSCSLSPGPPQKISTATTTIITATTARKRSSWMLSHHEKPGWQDTTTATPFEGPQQHHNHKEHKDHGSPTRQHTHRQGHQKSGSCDQVVPTTSPHSPPSSPVPLGLHKQNGATVTDTTALAREVADMDSEDDQHRRYKQHLTGRVVQGRSSAASDYGSEHHSARSAMQATAESATAARSRRKETGGSTRTATMTTPEISSRPRFSLSTVVNPRSQVYSVGTANREAAAAVPKDVLTKTTTAQSSRTLKESVATLRVAKSTIPSLGVHVQPNTKSASTTRISKSRSPTTITTTTTTTTRRVASTTITMGPHHDREHRKLAAANASTAAAGAHSAETSSSSSRKERTTRASNLSPATAGAGRATMNRVKGRQTGVEPIVEHTNVITIPTTVENNDNEDATTQHLNIAEPTTTTSTTLLPTLQTEGEEESPAVIECSRPVQKKTSTPKGVSINNPSSQPSSPSPPPSAASTEIPPLILSSPIIIASRPKTPPPPYQTAILHNTPSSDMVRQTLSTPSIATCSPTKETTPIVQEQHEHMKVYLAKPPVAVMTTPLSKTETSPLAGSAQSPGIAKSMTATTVSAPPTFLSGTPGIFRVMRETSCPRVLDVQQQPRLTSHSEIKAGGDQERAAEVPTTPVPTTMHRSKPAGLTAEEPTETRSTLPTTSTPITIPNLVGAEEAPKPQSQPFRKNIWNGRVDRFTKPWSTPLYPEEAIPTTQENAPARIGILAAMGTSVSRAPLTKVKDPAVMRDLMVLAKERRASRTLCDGVAEDGVSEFRSASSGGNQFQDRSRMRMQFEHGNNNDNDKPTTTNFTTNHNNTCNSLSTSAPSGKITFEDKKAFLKTQEMRRRSNMHRSRSLNTVDLPYYPFPTSPSPAPAQDSLSIDTRPGFPWKGRVATATPPIPAMSVTIPLKVATVLEGMGYPINNTNNTSATPPLCSSPSPSLSPTWSTPSTPCIIPSSLSTSSISSFSSISTASSSVSSMSSANSASSKTLPLSFPDRLFRARSPSSAGGAPVAMMPRSFSPRPVGATSITGASGPSSYYSTQIYKNNQTPQQSSTMLPSLLSPALSLAAPERQRFSNRSVEGYFKPRLFSGSRSENEQQVRQHTLRPFEMALVQQQQQIKLTPSQRAAAAGVHALWSGSVIKSNTMPQHLPPPLSPSPSSSSSHSITDQEDSTTDSDRERRVHERSVSTTSLDRPFFTEQVYSNQYSQEDQHSCFTTTQPVTQDISFLTKRLANLQLMDSLCPVSTPTPTQSLLPQQQQQHQQQQQQGGMDATWAMQIQLLLAHLAEQTDIEQESRPRPLPPPPRPHSLLLPLPEEQPEASQKKSAEGMGLYQQVLTDWLLRLDQLSTITSLSTGSSLYKDHPGLKREVEKIRWQHNVPSKPNNRSK